MQVRVFIGVKETQETRGPNRKSGSARLIIQQNEISDVDQATARPLRSSLPGVAPVHLFSSKIGWPLTMIQR